MPNLSPAACFKVIQNVLVMQLASDHLIRLHASIEVCDLGGGGHLLAANNRLPAPQHPEANATQKRQLAQTPRPTAEQHLTATKKQLGKKAITNLGSTTCYEDICLAPKDTPAIRPVNGLEAAVLFGYNAAQSADAKKAAEPKYCSAQSPLTAQRDTKRTKHKNNKHGQKGKHAIHSHAKHNRGSGNYTGGFIKRRKP